MKKGWFITLCIVMCLSLGGCKETASDEECSVSGCTNPVYKDGLCPDHYVSLKESDTDINEDGEQKSDNDEPNNANDSSINMSVASPNEVGLKNIKIDSGIINMTPEQELLMRYFDKDYFWAQYTFVRKYPQFFEKMQVETRCVVVKIISQDNDNYELLGAWGWNYREDMGEYENSEYETGGLDQLKEELVCIRGTTKDQYFMEKDNLNIKGRFSGIETITVDGVSYTVPVINAYSENEDFSYEEIKTIAEGIFGEQISISKKVIADMEIDGIYQITLDNQKNSKFGKYTIYSNGAGLDDDNDSLDIRHRIEFAPDFEHFFIFIFDKTVNNLTIEYYDKDLNQIWKREFLDTTIANYDYTKSYAYVVVNGYLYIIDMTNGEDVIDKKYVGQKIELRKIADGILLFAKDKSEAVMMTDNEGNIIWTANMQRTLGSVNRTQFRDNMMICSYDAYDGEGYWDEDYGPMDSRYDGFMQIDLKTGEIVQEVEELAYFD